MMSSNCMKRPFVAWVNILEYHFKDLDMVQISLVEINEIIIDYMHCQFALGRKWSMVEYVH